MASYLERYLAGEQERVWDELVALGEAVREEPVHADALAVARETMRRARANIEALIPRLVRTGYLFGYGWIQPPAFAPFGWRERKWYSTSQEWARKQPPIFTSATDAEDEIIDAHSRLDRLRELQAPLLIIENWERHLAELEAPVTVNARAQLDAFEQEVGLLPISVRAWYEVVSGVNFVGHHPEWLTLLRETDSASQAARERDELRREETGRPFHYMTKADPLFVYPFDASRVWQDQRQPASYRLPMRPDEFTLYGEHGAPWQDTIEVPCPGADALLRSRPHGVTFVQYLRICFRWGGFPGWERIETRPERDLAFLTEGLLPL